MKQVLDGEIKVAFGSRLQGLPKVITLGVRPNLGDYTPYEWVLIESAPVLYYPTPFLAQPLLAMGKRLFPNASTYFYVGDKIRQTTLFHLLGIPHPKTRVFFPRHYGDIMQHFSFPFLAKIPRSSDSGRGVFLIRNREELSTYLRKTRVAYIQEYLPDAEDYRVVVIGYKPIIAYRRRPQKGEFRANLACGGSIEFQDIPERVTEIAVQAARSCGFDDVGIDVLRSGSSFYVLEANFRYGRKGFAALGLDYKKILEDLLERGDI